MNNTTFDFQGSDLYLGNVQRIGLAFLDGSGMPAGFKGVLDISSTTPFAALTIRSLVNEDGDFLLTTFPVADVNQAGPSPVIFPQIVHGVGYSTEFVLISPAGASNTVVSYYDDSGNPLAVGR